MIKLIRLLCISLLVISCKKENETPAVTDTQATTEANVPDTIIHDSATGMSDTEDNVYKVIERIKTSKPENRKKELENFIWFGDRVDGAVSEAYSNFAFEYEKSNKKDFYSVLTQGDTVLLKKWVAAAKKEIDILAEDENEVRNILQEMRSGLRDKSLSADEKKLAKYYYKRMAGSFPNFPFK